MPENYHRKEIRLQPATVRKLDSLRKEGERVTGKKISRNDLIVEIIEQFLEKNSSVDSSCNPMKKGK